MRIRGIEAIPVLVPRAHPTRSALGRFATTSAGIVRVTTDDGVEGVGEIALIWHGGGAALCHDLNTWLGPALVGEDPMRLTHIHGRLDELCAFGRHTLVLRAAIDMALHDIAGKCLGAPAYQLLGGRVREGIELSMSIHMDAPEAMVAQAVAYWQAGFRTVKVKVGGEAEADVRAVRAIREALGDAAKIRVDANMGWRTAKEALAMIARLAPYGILSVEQPLGADDLAGLAFVRAHSEVPVMVDESVWSPQDAWRVIRAGAADILNVYVAEAGGLAPALEIFRIAGLAGLECAIGSMPELGIGTAAQAHLGVAAPWLRHPSDVAGSLYQADDLIVTPLRVEDGFAYPPEGPGLGVEPDWEKVAFYRAT